MQEQAYPDSPFHWCWLTTPYLPWVRHWYVEDRHSERSTQFCDRPTYIWNNHSTPRNDTGKIVQHNGTTSGTIIQHHGTTSGTIIQRNGATLGTILQGNARYNLTTLLNWRCSARCSQMSRLSKWQSSQFQHNRQSFRNPTATEAEGLAEG